MKPKSILAAKNLFFAAIFVSVVVELMQYFNLGAPNPGPWLISVVLGYALLIMLVKQVSRRKEWARTVLLLLFILIVLSTVWVTRLQPGPTMVAMVLYIFQDLLLALGIIFLFRRESTIWLRSAPSEDQSHHGSTPVKPV